MKLRRNFDLHGVFALDAERRIARRRARIEHQEEAIAYAERHPEEESSHRKDWLMLLRDEIVLLRPYWGAGITKEEAVRAWHVANPDIPSGFATHFVEVEAINVEETDGIFFVHESLSDAPGWSLTHEPTGFLVVRVPKGDGAHYIGEEIYHAAPEAWKLTDAEAIKQALPPLVHRWVKEMHTAAWQGINICALPDYQAFAREPW